MFISGRFRLWITGVAFASSLLAANAGATDSVEADFAPVLLGSIEADLPSRHLPSSAFAQRVMLSQPRITEIEIGVVATWAPGKDFPHTIFAASDDFEAYGHCSEREVIGCTMDVFDYSAGQIRTYLMPLSQAKRLDTYGGLLSRDRSEVQSPT